MLGNIVERAIAVDKKGQRPIERPRDRDAIAAADKLLGWAYGRPAVDNSLQGLVGSYDFGKLNDEQLRTVTEILRLAAPPGAVAETD